jgi:hypothetical protein
MAHTEKIVNRKPAAQTVIGTEIGIYVANTVPWT